MKPLPPAAWVAAKHAAANATIGISTQCSPILKGNLDKLKSYADFEKSEGSSKVWPVMRTCNVAAGSGKRPRGALFPKIHNRWQYRSVADMLRPVLARLAFHSGTTVSDVLFVASSRLPKAGQRVAAS
jgi:hypothetical protein